MTEAAQVNAAPAKATPTVAKSARVIALATLGSRILGSARDVMTAYYFGAGMLTDAFVIAFVIPNLFRRLLGEGALSSAFLPVYAHYVETKERAEADRMASNIFCITGALLLVLVVTGCAGSAIWQSMAVPGSKEQLIARLLFLLLPYMFFICLTAICQAVLNTHRHFLTPAMAPVVLNVFWIAGLMLAGKGPETDWSRIYIVGASILVGGVVQLAMQGPALRRRGFAFTFGINFQDEGLRRVLATLVPVVVGIGVLQINSVLDNLIAETLIPGDGAVSYLYYANRLLQFPLSVIGMAVAVAAFPTFSTLFARGDTEQLRKELLRALQITFYVSFPATVGLILIREPLVYLLFGHGRFAAAGPEAIQRQEVVVMYYGLGVWAHCMVQVLTRAFYAVGDPRTPFRVAAYMVAFNFCLNLLLVGRMQEAGLALATSVSGVAVLIALLWRAKANLSFAPDAWFLGGVAKTVVGSLLMGAACYGALAAFGESRLAVLYGSAGGRALVTCAVLAAGLVAYSVWSAVMQRSSLKAVLRK